MKQEKKMNVKAVLLAAGSSTRFEGNKLLADFDGMPVFSYAFDAVKTALMKEQITGAVVVTQYLEIAMAARFMDYCFDCVPNEQPELGISHSLKLGLKAALDDDPDTDAVMFVVCDQPYICGETLCRMAEAADENHILRTSSTDGSRKGSPTLFPRKYMKELMELSGDEGGRALMQKYPERVRDIFAEDERELMDVDTKEELAALTE